MKYKIVHLVSGASPFVTVEDAVSEYASGGWRLVAVSQGLHYFERDDNQSDSPARYWGIWCAPPDSKPGWMRDANGRFYYYPSPAIAQAAADDVGWSHTSVREFTVADVLGDGP